MVTWFDVETDESVVRVRCHGAEQEMRLSLLQLMQFQDVPMGAVGLAFDDPAPALGRTPLLSRSPPAS